MTAAGVGKIIIIKCMFVKQFSRSNWFKRLEENNMLFTIDGYFHLHCVHVGAISPWFGSSKRGKLSTQRGIAICIYRRVGGKKIFLQKCGRKHVLKM
jgi:hypothetical protein